MRLSVFFLAASLLSAQALRIERGVTDFQVFQRGPANAADIHVEGTAGGVDGRAVEVRVITAGMPLAGFDWQAAGKTAAGRWWAELKGLPAGGPYRLEFRAAGGKDPAAVANVLVGDLWVLAGQSNMEGVGKLAAAERDGELARYDRYLGSGRRSAAQAGGLGGQSALAEEREGRDREDRG